MHTLCVHTCNTHLHMRTHIAYLAAHTCTCTRLPTCTLVHVYNIHAHTHVRIPACTHTCMPTCALIHTHAHVCTTYMHMCVQHICTRVCVYMHARTCLPTCTLTHTCTCTTHMRMYTCMRAHTCVSACTLIYTHAQHVGTCLPAHSCTYTCTTYVHTHAHMYTYSCMHTQAPHPTPTISGTALQISKHRPEHTAARERPGKQAASNPDSGMNTCQVRKRLTTNV